MPKQLAELEKSWVDIKKRVTPMLDFMTKRDADFWAPGHGFYPRMLEGVTMLGERILALNQAGHAGNTAAHFPADPEVQQYVRFIDEMKAKAREVSQQYWGTAMRVDAIRKEVLRLKEKADAVAKTKSEQFTKSKSLAAIESLSKALDNFAGDLNLTVSQGPHKPNHAMLN